MNTQLTMNQKIAQLLASKPVILQMLKFAAIGSLNTALDFVILNYVTKTLGIEPGVSLGLVNIIGFSAAIIQSYLWNRAWTFASSMSTPLANAFRLILVGGLGFLAFSAVVIGGLSSVADTYYLFILIVFLFLEICMWFGFRLSMNNAGKNTEISHQFSMFVLVSIIGLVINSAIVALAANALAPTLSNLINADTIINLSKVIATAVSLIWNFIGYKMLVFKK